MKWATSEKFKDYLWDSKVIVVTDNNPLIHLHTAKLGAVEQRWVAQLQATKSSLLAGGGIQTVGVAGE